MFRGFLFTIATLLAFLPYIAAVTAEMQLNVSRLATANSGEATSNDTFYAVDIFKQLQAYAALSNGLDKLASDQRMGENALVDDSDVYRSFQAFVGPFIDSMDSSNGLGWSDSVVAQIRDAIQRYPASFGYGRSQQPTVLWMRLFSEKWLCTYVSTAFSTTVMDRNGDAWLFSDAFDNDLASLDRAIAHEFDAAYHSTRFHCSVSHETFLPLFDQIYDRCVGDKLAALHRLQAS